jgi:hypothetical protein
LDGTIVQITFAVPFGQRRSFPAIPTFGLLCLLPLLQISTPEQNVGESYRAFIFEDAGPEGSTQFDTV